MVAARVVPHFEAEAQDRQRAGTLSPSGDKVLNTGVAELIARIDRA